LLELKFVVQNATYNTWPQGCVFAVINNRTPFEVEIKQIAPLRGRKEDLIHVNIKTKPQIRVSKDDLFELNFGFFTGTGAQFG
jgi:hypothetical protein